jgi:hypothetical protein
MKGCRRLNQEAEPIGQKLIDRMGELIAIMGLDKARKLAVGIFVGADWTLDEAAGIVDRVVKAWTRKQGDVGETNERGLC